MDYAVSVITPVYNGEAFIEACLLNVIEQDCPEAEHLIMDGASTDGTLEIVKRYAKRYPHIRWVSERDHGQSHAMNQGLAIARANVLGFLNSDDYYEPGVLKKVVRMFQTLKERSFLVANCRLWDEFDRSFHVIRPKHLTRERLLLGFRYYEFPVNPSSYFYHKSLHTFAGLYDEHNHLNMDLDFLIRALPYANVTHVDQVWGNFRVIPGSKTHTVSVVLDRSKDYDTPLLNYYRGCLNFTARLKLFVLFLVYFVIRFYQCCIHRSNRWFGSK